MNFASAPVLCHSSCQRRIDRPPGWSGSDLDRSGAAASPGLVTDVSRQSTTGDARNKDHQLVVRLKAMSEEAAHLASALASQPPDGKGAGAGARDRRSKSPEEVLKLLIEMRRIRFRHFETALFTNPGWDMLLDIMALRLAGRQVPVSSACVAAGVPATTALRLISALVEAGLVSRRADPADGRRVLVDLTEDGRCRMEVFLRAIGRLIG